MWWNGLARAVMLTAAMLAVSAAVPAETAHAPASRPLYTTQAPIVMLKDMDSGAILFERGAGKCFAPASMAKVMTAYVVLDLIDSGKVSRDKMRSEEHTSELQSLMRNSYAVFCLKKKKTTLSKIT